MKIDWSYPFFFSYDLKSFYRSVWLGWWLITWCEPFPDDLKISFQPGL